MGTDESHTQQVVEMVAQLALRHEDQLQLVCQDMGFGCSCVSRRRCPCSPNFTKWGEADDGLQNGRGQQGGPARATSPVWVTIVQARSTAH